MRSFSANGRASVMPFSYIRPHGDLESEIHQVEQEAYTGVLRAFKVQSDAISWVCMYKKKNLVLTVLVAILCTCLFCVENKKCIFFVQEKESLITELRKELRVSDDEHRELLNKVNEDVAIRRMRSSYNHSIFVHAHV